MELAFWWPLRDHETIQGQAALSSVKNGRRDGRAAVGREGESRVPGSLTQEHSRRTRGDRHSSRVEAKNPALLSNRDGYLLELTGWTQGSQAS